MARSHDLMVGRNGTRRASATQHTLFPHTMVVPSGSITVAGMFLFLSLLRTSFIILRFQSVSGHHQHGRQPDSRTSSTTPPFEETARFLCQHVHQHPIPLFAKLCGSSMIASSLSTRLNQIKPRPLLSVASYHQVPSGTRTGDSCSIESSDPMHPNKKYTTQLLALCCSDY